MKQEMSCSSSFTCNNNCPIFLFEFSELEREMVYLVGNVVERLNEGFTIFEVGLAKEHNSLVEVQLEILGPQRLQFGE
jgi:hypothetical protein